MRTRIFAILAFVSLAALLSAGCAASRSARDWRPGEAIICPHCGQQFAIPEKLGE